MLFRSGRTRTIASGPVTFMDIWDAMCATVLSTGARRGAMMATLRCDHPDIAEFVDAKREAGRLTRFNVSVLVTDELMAAVRADAAWPLVFPADGVPGDAAEGALAGRLGQIDSPAYRFHRMPLWSELDWTEVFDDSQTRAGRDDVYYLRVRQVNRQWGWSSPIRVLG